MTRTGKTREPETIFLFSAQYAGKVVVLTGPFTASSSEIFSHAMQSYRRATVIGEKTAGSVEAGFAHRLPGGGYVNVADLDYIGLDGLRLEGVGVTPDISVPLTLADLRAGRDAGLEAVLAWMSGDLAGKN